MNKVDKNGDCDLCRNTSGNECQSIGPKPKQFICTREKGHKGKHAACGYLKDEHPLQEWEEKDALTDTELTS